jgi:hypothetical protein
MFRWTPFTSRSWFALFIFGAACGLPTAPASPSYLLATSYILGCAWEPSVPTVPRAVFDIQVPGDDTAPASEGVVAPLTFAGARVDYRFHGPMVRAEIDVAALTSLWQAKAVTFATSVSDFSNHDHVFLLEYSRPVTAADQQAVVNLGATIIRVLSSALNAITLTVDDAKAPSLAALPGVTTVEFDTASCALDAAQHTIARQRGP